MALGRVRSGDFRKGSPMTLPHTFGSAVKLSVDTATDHDNFGNTIPSNGANENVVNWSPSPAHFGNSIGGTPVTPTFSNPAGTYTESQAVLIISAGADAIFFTTDGSTPTTASTLYTGSVKVNVSQTIKAIAVINGTPSSVGVAAYVIS